MDRIFPPSSDPGHPVFRRRGIRLAKRRFALRPIADAVQMLVDCMGVCVLFLAFNIVAGALAILLIRSLTPIFVSLYTLDNIVLPVLSVVQGLIFRFWWQHD